MKTLLPHFERNDFGDSYQQGRSSGSTEEIRRLGGHYPDMQAKVQAASLLVCGRTGRDGVCAETSQQEGEACEAYWRGYEA